MKSESIRQAAARDRTGARDGRARVTPRTQFGSQPAGAEADWSTSAGLVDVCGSCSDVAVSASGRRLRMSWRLRQRPIDCTVTTAGKMALPKPASRRQPERTQYPDRCLCPACAAALQGPEKACALARVNCLGARHYH